MLQTSAQIVCTQSLPPEMRPIPFFAWLAMNFTKAGDVESHPGLTTRTNKHTPVIWICDLCHKQMNKQQTSIRCNHTHKNMGSYEMHTDKTATIQTGRGDAPSTHTHKSEQQHITNKSPPTHSQTNHHQPTHKQQSTKGHKHCHTSNQYKRPQTQNRGTKKPRTQHPTGHHHNTRNETHTES